MHRGDAPSPALRDNTALVLSPLCGDGRLFVELTFPRYRIYLTGGDPDIVAATGRVGDTPVGLALMQPEGSPGAMRLLSLAVAPEWRRHGFAPRLLHYCTTLAMERGHRSFVSFHSSRLPATSAFEATLDRAGWTQPEAVNIRVAAKVAALASAARLWPAMRRLLQRQDFTFSPWRAADQDDAAALAALTREPGCRAELHLEQWQAHLDPDTSLLIRRNGQPVGWVVCAPADASGDGNLTIYVPAAYIRDDLWASGILTRAYLRVFELLIEKYGTDVQLHFATGPQFPGMMALTVRRLAPAALWVDEWRRSILIATDSVIL